MHDRICKWLSPPEFIEVLERSQYLREDGTNQWIFEDSNFKAWSQRKRQTNQHSDKGKTSPSMLWIHGRAKEEIQMTLFEGPLSETWQADLTQAILDAEKPSLHHQSLMSFNVVQPVVVGRVRCTTFFSIKLMIRQMRTHARHSDPYCSKS